MTPYKDLKERLARSKFRSRFRLTDQEKCYVAEKGPAELRKQAEKILCSRLAPAWPENDGRQTPMKGHAVFIAQHALGICCRKCLAQWHGIPAGRPLTEMEITFLTNVIMAWIMEQCPMQEYENSRQKREQQLELFD